MAVCHILKHTYGVVVMLQFKIMVKNHFSNDNTQQSWKCVLISGLTWHSLHMS